MSAINRLVRSFLSLSSLAAFVALAIVMAPTPAAAADTCGIGDFVWHDLNKNGIQDADEPGINGVKLTVQTPKGPFTVVTANHPMSGKPGFYVLLKGCGNYTVTVTLPTGFDFTVPNASAGTPQTDSNANGSTVAVNGQDLSIDFGLVAVCTGSIGDFVWSDVNWDGIQTGEAGVTGVNVTLTGTDQYGRSVSQSTTTNTGGLGGGLPGYYLFPGVCQGDYAVTVTRPSGFNGFSPLDQGGDDSVDSDGTPSGSGTSATALVSVASNNAENLTIDFGLVPPCSGTIGDFVWTDLNANGVQDLGEPGIDGISVSLLDGGGHQVRIANTETNGHYQFDGLCSGSYTVVVTRPVHHPQFSPIGDGSNYALDSNGVPSDDKATATAAVTLPANNSSNQTIDFGFYSCSGSIGNFVWKDLNRDGLQADEPGIPGVVVELRDGNGAPLQNTTTDVNGGYLFSGLCEGSYQVKVISGVPLNYTPTTPLVGDDQAVDSNEPLALVILLDDIYDDWTIDFGFVGPITLGDLVWIDSNGNGIQDNGEIGEGGVTVKLLDCSGNELQSTSTGADGLYAFTVVPGSYKVLFVLPTGYAFSPLKQGADDAIDSDADPNGQVLCALYTTDTNTIDAGLVVLPASLGNFVWNDLNHDGIQDGDEPGIAGVAVTVNGPGGSQTATTDGTGFYQFTDLIPGTYTVTVGAPPAGFVGTLTGAGTAATDSNASPTTVTLAAGDSDQTIDFGFWKPASIGDRVWNDLNKNGVQDAGEPGLTTGWTVNITGPNGYTNSMTPAGDGIYTFGNLLPGPYTVCTVPMANFVQTYDLDGVATANCATLTIAAGDNRTDVDFGYYLPASLGNFVWNDVNHNGIQDTGEPGISGVGVALTGPSGPLSTTTDANGLYQFANLIPGTYTVTVGTPPVGFVGTLTGAGTAATDSNPSPATVVLAAGESNQTIDFGFWKPASLGNFVWNDVNHNGIQDTGEPGISGVGVTLTGPSGPLSTTTDANGLYQFANLIPGTYMVTVGAGPTGFVTTLTGAGTPATDSNPSPATVVLAAGESNQTIDFGFYLYVPPPPGMTIVKTADKSTAAPYEPVLYSYLVTNTGGTPLTNIVVTDNNGTPAFAGDDFTVCTIPSLAPGAFKTCTATVIPVVSTESVVNGATVPAGAVIVVTNLAQSDPSCGTLGGCVKVTYLQDFGINDNTYGTGAIGWPASKIHKFSDLTGSDKLEFRFFDKNGNVVIDFYVDTITAATSVTVPGTGQVISYPSGYGTLGPFGGDGFMVAGDPNNIVTFSTSISENLNKAGNLPNKAALIVNSPTSLVGGNVVVDPAKAPGGWDHINNYSAVVKASAFAAGGGFLSVAVPDQHNSPNKLLGPNGMTTTPKSSTVVNTATAKAVTASGGGLTVTDTAEVKIVVPPPDPCSSLAMTTTKFSKKDFTVTIQNTGPAAVVLSAFNLTWPTANGKLLQINLGSNVVFTTDLNAPSASLTTAQLAAESTNAKRTLAAGAIGLLKMTFQNNANTTLLNYKGSFTFGGCVVKLN